MIFKAALVRGILIGSVAQYALPPHTYIHCSATDGLFTTFRFKDLLRLFSTHQVKPVVDKVFAFEEAAEAFNYLASQKHVENVVISVAKQ